MNISNDSSYGLIYISGRGASGKSTIAERFSRDLDFTLIALDELIRLEFNGDYKLYNKGERLDEFIQRIRDLIDLHKFCAIEGMIRSNDIIRRIFHGYAFTFCYITPSSEEVYLKNIRKRFVENPDHYGRLGFLRRYDEPTGSHGLKDFKDNGIDGSVISQMIDHCGKTEMDESILFCQQYQCDFQVITLIN